MTSTVYTSEQVAEAIPFVCVLKDAQPDKQLFARAIAEAFINGMLTQEQLMKRAQERPEPTPARQKGFEPPTFWFVGDFSG